MGYLIQYWAGSFLSFKMVKIQKVIVSVTYGTVQYLLSRKMNLAVIHMIYGLKGGPMTLTTACKKSETKSYQVLVRITKAPCDQKTLLLAIWYNMRLKLLKMLLQPNKLLFVMLWDMYDINNSL